MSLFIGNSYTPDMAELVAETQVERYMGTWQTSEGTQPVGYSVGCRKRDRLDRLRLNLRNAEFFHGKDSEIYREILTA